MKISRALAFVLGALALVCGAGASAQAPSRYVLLENANSSGPEVGVRGGNYILSVSGGFGGATLTFSESIDATSTTLATFTAAAVKCFNIPNGALVKVAVSGGSPSGLKATLGDSGSCHALSYADANNLNQTVSPAYPLPTFAGGYEFNKSVIPTVQNAAYAAGQSLGGLQTISIGTNSGLSGILDQIGIASTGGSTVAVVVYVWDTNPANTTCTDKTNFVKSQTDNQRLITGTPILLTPALVVSAQDAATYAAATNLVDNFVNGSSNTNLYVCVLANASVTPGTTSDYRLNIQGIKDQP
jgi:hypothetical protein